MKKESNALRLRVQTVFSAVLEGHKTFGELAPQYGMTEEEFEKNLVDKVCKKDFMRLKKESDRNKSAQAKKTCLEEEKNSADEAIEEQAEQEDKTEVTQMSRETLMVQLENAEKQIALFEDITIPAVKDILSTAETSVAEAEIALVEAKKTLTKAKKLWNKAQKEVKDKEISLEEWKKCREMILAQIADIDDNVIYLIAPDYHGDFTKHGTFISVVEMEGVTVECANDVPLLHEMSLEDAFMFEEMHQAKEAYAYLKLVAKYFAESKEYHLLVDSHAIVTLLYKQELISEEELEKMQSKKSVASTVDAE